MSRLVAVIWHGAFSLIAGVLYFFFVLPRWAELSGDTPPTLGTVLRIVAGVLIGLAALPVVFTWLRTRRPEYGTPRLALTLRVLSIALHVLGGTLIVGTAISEIWLSLDDVGQWLFGIYGAAAAICLLGITSFYLAFVAELPPLPPRPLKAKASKQRRRRKKAAEPAADEEVDEKSAAAADEEPVEEATEEKPAEEPAEEKPVEVIAEEPATTAEDEPSTAEQTPAAEESTEEPSAEPSAESTDESSAEPETPTAEDEPPAAPTAEDTDTVASEPAGGGLLGNRRPSGKGGGSRWRRKSRGSVALADEPQTDEN
jgi:hypothetical protein